MKKNRIILLAGLMTIGVFSFFTSKAQDNFTIKMSIKTEGLPAEMAAYGEQDLTTLIKGNKMRTEISSMMFSNITYINDQTITSLSDAMGNKTGYVTTKLEIEAADKDKPNVKPSIVYTEEKKMIAGYECKKAIVTSKEKDDKESVTIVWVTDKIVNINQSVGKSNRRGMTDLSDLKGYPLEMEMPMTFQGSEAKVVMTTLEVSIDLIDDAMFVPNTEGYKMVSYKEMLEMQKMMRQQGR